MKIICTQENLVKAISQIERVAGRQSTLPILSNFLLETDKGRLKLSATNLEIGIVSHIGAKIEREGKITVPGKLLSGFVHNLPAGDVVTLEVEGSSLKVESQGYTVKIKGLDGKDFPIIPQYTEDYFFSFPAQNLKNALGRLLFCASTNESRLELTGVHISFFEDTLHLAATDSFRLAEEIVPLSSPGERYADFRSSTPTLILPASTLAELVRIIGPESTEVNMALAENQIFFEIDSIQIVSRTINGKYPDYKQIIPKSFTLSVLLEKDALQRAVRIAGTFSSYNSGEIAIIFDPGAKTCTLVSRSQEIGENTSVLPAEFMSGEEPVTAVFNPRYILEGAGAFVSEKIVFSVNDGASPAALRAYDEKKQQAEGNYLYIVMPIRK